MMKNGNEIYDYERIITTLQFLYVKRVLIRKCRDQGSKNLCQSRRKESSDKTIDKQSYRRTAQVATAAFIAPAQAVK